MFVDTSRLETWKRMKINEHSFQQNILREEILFDDYLLKEKIVENQMVQTAIWKHFSFDWVTRIGEKEQEDLIQSSLSPLSHR